MTAAKDSDIFQPGDVLNNTYRIEAILGRGGTSEVYKARSEISGRVIAIKALRAEFASNEDFLVLMTREEDVREIRHDAVVRYFDTQRMPDGVVYLVMDHVDGPGLDHKLADGGMNASDLMVVGQRVCEGLIAAHARKIVHRDLSPDNIILRNDIPSEAVIIDFGIAKDTNPGAETIVGNEFAGKYAYAAPEQLSGNTDARSDIYSLGALLLSTFRGAKPNIGNNPMEVVQKKGEPLDLDGVPEPLRGLIAKMTDPDPAKRFQTAEELLAGFKNPNTLNETKAASGDILDDLLGDETVIAPMPRPPVKEAEPTPPAKPSRSSTLVPILATLVVVGGAGGAWFSGALDSLLGPSYPIADPFTLMVEKTAEGTAQATGFIPAPEMQEALESTIAELGGTTTLSLASGEITETWAPGVLDIVKRALPLDEFRISITNDVVTVSGLAPSRDALANVQAAFSEGFPAGLNGSAQIGLGPRFLPPAQVEPLLDARADCGRLQLMSPPPVGYGLEDTVIVNGRFASDLTRAALESDIANLAGDRTIRVEGEILNASLCQIDAVLPKAGPGGFDVRLGYGDRTGENLSGRYVVGENPTIDIKLPEDTTDGYLWVSVIDVKGVVFHLLPNRTRPDNSIATLRAQAQDGFVRVAYGLQEAQKDGLLAFTVDDSVLGKSKIIALHSDAALFDELRPTTESAASYAAALTDAGNTAGFYVNSLDSALLTTSR